MDCRLWSRELTVNSFRIVWESHVERGGWDGYQLCTENRPNELSNFKFDWQIPITCEGRQVLRSAMQMRKSKSERIHDREFVHTNRKDWWPVGFNVRLRHGIFKSWIIIVFMDRKQTWMHLISNYRYIIRKNHKIVTFIILLHVHIGGIGSCVLVAHATLGKTKSLCCLGRDQIFGHLMNEQSIV
jgi:hypothetical protein